MRFWAKLTNLYTKLLVTILLVIAPICGISLIMNDYGERNVREEIRESIQSRVSFYSNLLQNEFDRIITMEEEYINDRVLRKLIFSDAIISDIERYESVVTIHNQLRRMVNTSPYIQGASLYIPALDRWISNTEMLAEISDEPYTSLISVRNRYKDPFVYWEDRLFVSFPYYGVSIRTDQAPRFLVSVEVDLEVMKEVLDRFAIGGAGGSFMTSSNGDWVLKSNNASLPENEFRRLLDAIPAEASSFIEEADIQGEKYWLVGERTSLPDVTLVSYMPESEIVGSLTLYRTWYWVISALSVLVIAFLAFWIFLQIHQPLRRLMRAFREVEHGNLGVQLSHRRHDEFGYVYIQFNSMVAQIKKLINEVYEQKFRANQSELRQLQAQINPHFLYNSFFILYRMSRQEDNESIARFTSYLGRYFEFIARTQRGIIRLKEEVEFSRTYVEIQSIRFENRISVRFEPLPAEFENMEVPRLILQPLVENVYEHGLKNMIEGGHLEVRFERSADCLAIVVEDNGAEMPEEDFLVLQRKLSAADRIDFETTGLINVHRRVRLAFGSRAGVTFERRPGGGNRVSLWIPVVPES